MKLIPLADYVLVAPEEDKKETESGIILPDTVEGETPQLGSVIDLGPDTKGSLFKSGHRVVYKKWAGNEFDNEGTTVIFVRAEDLLAIID